MKKIICPTDFSKTANKAIEYAANLVKKSNLEFEIIHIEVLSTTHPIASGMEVRQNMPATFDTLERMCNLVNQAYSVNCNYSVETTEKTIENVISNRAESNTLIVMGTNGTDDVYQSVFGTNTYQVIRKAKCPVLMIPDGIAYQPFKKVVFAWDYTKNNKVSFLQLQNILKDFHFEVQIDFLHISKEKTVIGDDVFNALKEEICSYTGKDNNISFHRIFSEDPDLFADRIDDYMNDSGADMLAVTYYDRGIVKNMFHGKVAKDLTEIAGYPLLVLHV